MEQNKNIIYRDHPLFYRISGSGNPVVLIHGFAEDGAIWKNQQLALEKNYRVIVPDLPGSGQSPEWGDMSMEELAESVKAILDAESIPSASLIGHSMGGYITLALIEKYPEMASSFCLFHSTAYADTEEKKETRQKSIEFITRNGTVEFLRQSTPNMFSAGSKKAYPERVNELIYQYENFKPQNLVAYYEAMMRRPDRTAVLRTFQRPVLFILGRHDMAIPLKDGLEQCHLPVLSYIHILDESGHMGLWEESSESNRILTEFLENK
ncbi:MAG: alpha/beta hydrolase [Chitinophagaceae bacterium]|nr:alpha/beta hydrolase [Chitinophagaceae bacterium]